MDNKDELITKLKRENAYLRTLLEQAGTLKIISIFYIDQLRILKSAYII